MTGQEGDTEPEVGADSLIDTKREKLVELGERLLALAEQEQLDPEKIRMIGNGVLDLAERIRLARPLTGAAIVGAQRGVAARARPRLSMDGEVDASKDKPVDVVDAPPKPRSTVEESIAEVAALRTAEEIAAWLTSLRPEKPVSAAQVQALPSMMTRQFILVVASSAFTPPDEFV